MSDFVKVPDALRDELAKAGNRDGRSVNPLYEALAAGETVFVALNGRRSHNVRQAAGLRMRDRGFRVITRKHSIQGVVGLVMWAEKVSA